MQPLTTDDEKSEAAATNRGGRGAQRKNSDIPNLEVFRRDRRESGPACGKSAIMQTRVVVVEVYTHQVQKRTCSHC